MNRWIVILVLTWLCCNVIPGCSDGTGTSPVIPPTEQDLDLETSAGQNVTSTLPDDTQTYLWGYYDLYFDSKTRSIKVSVNRAAMYAVNVVQFLNNSPAGLQVVINSTPVGPDYIDIDLDVTITHPFAGLDKFNGYDVRGIFIGNGSGTIAYNPDFLFAVAGTDQVLLNADGYSRWFNPGEFISPGIFGYVQGNLAPATYEGTATLNPYKYFGEGLGAQDDLWTYMISGGPEVGYFKSGTSNTRNYVIRFPMPNPGIKYGYAVVANWEGGEPADHPSHAAEAVAIDIVDHSGVYYVDGVNNGGNFKLDISVFDWGSTLSGVSMEDYRLFVVSDVLTDTYTFDYSEMTPVGSGDHYYTYHSEFPADNVVGSEGSEMWVIVRYYDHDYTNPFGVPNNAGMDRLEALFRYEVQVLTEEPATIQVLVPNGFEVWATGADEEISWTSNNVTGNVNIEYSRDYFISDIHTISMNEPNDGIYLWQNIPFAPTDLARIRVESVDDPSVYDISDDIFIIVAPFIMVFIPNGGEVWEKFSDKTIYWFSEGVETVDIEYSRDLFVADIHTIILCEPNTDSYDWQDIPFAPTILARIRVSSSDEPSINDMSDNDFSIVEPTIQVETPNGGEVWDAGTNETILWTSDLVPGLVFIEYSKDNFVSDIQPIASDEANDGSFLWENIPFDSSSTVRVRVSSTDIPAVNDISDADFQIFAPTIQINVPNGGEFWPSLSSNDILWTSQDVSGTVEIEYSEDNFVSDINLLATGETNDGSYTWNNWSCMVTENARIRVSSTSDPGINDVSDADFTIDSGWADTWGITGDGRALGVVEDGTGYVYVTGYESVPGNAIDVYLRKYNECGQLYWEAVWGGTGWDSGQAITLDNLGYVYVTGRFEGTVDFDTGGGTENRTSKGLNDVYVSKFDQDGAFQWVEAWGWVENDYGNGIYTDSLNNVYISGSFRLTVDFDPGGGVDSHTSIAEGDIYLSKLDSSGNFQWARTWGGSSNDSGNSIVIDSSDGIYLGGQFVFTVDFDPDPVDVDNKSTVGLMDAFISKFDSSGDYLWAITWGGTAIDYTDTLAMDNFGNIYACGPFETTTDFDPDPVGEANRTAIGESDAYVCKFDPSGVFQWVQTWGGTEYDGSRGVAVNDIGDVYVTGFFQDTVDFDPDPVGVELLTEHDGESDAFVCKYDSFGTYQWARGFGGSMPGTYGYDITADSSGHAFAAGIFGGTVEFAPTGAPCNAATDQHTGSYDNFIIKYLPDGCW